MAASLIGISTNALAKAIAIQALTNFKVGDEQGKHSSDAINATGQFVELGFLHGFPL